MGEVLSKIFPLEKDAKVAFNGSAAGVTATTPHDASTALLTQAPVSTGQESVGALTRVADATCNSSSETLTSAKLP